VQPSEFSYCWWWRVAKRYTDNIVTFQRQQLLASATQCYFIHTLPCFMWGISPWRIDGQSLKLITHCHLLMRLESGLHSLVLTCSYRITSTLSLVKQFNGCVIARVNVQNTVKWSSACIPQWTQVYILHAWHSAHLTNKLASAVTRLTCIREFLVRTSTGFSINMTGFLWFVAFCPGEYSYDASNYTFISCFHALCVK